MAKIYMTRERRLEVEDELQRLKGKERKEIANKIAEARSHGDLSENADYDAAKDEQGLLELRIAKLSNMLANSIIIDSKDFPDDKVYILSKVKIKNKKNGFEMEYLMVSPEEADFEKNKLSVDSPVGKALMGKKIGESVEVIVPAGKTEFEIVSISK
jgi:transcription elongation factor GreA